MVTKSAYKMCLKLTRMWNSQLDPRLSSFWSTKNDNYCELMKSPMLWQLSEIFGKSH